jgi:hypothetical protein
MKPLISFCSQCKGRKHHLKKTLHHNLSCIEEYDECDFVLLDFDSPDGLEEWVKTNFKDYLESGKLKYHKVENQPHYFQSAVKNLSHHLSTGKNVINIDADNFMSISYVLIAIKEFKKYPNSTIVTETPNKKDYDLFGRIGMSRKIFDLVKGYDECFEHWGGEDHDILRRIHNLSEQMDIHEVGVSAKIAGHAIIHGAIARAEYRTEITTRYLPPNKITSRYYGSLFNLKINH